LPIEFDSYYFCLMAGLAAGRKKELPLSATDEIVQYFPGNYTGKGKLIVALFLKRELDALGMRLDERKAVHETIAKLVAPDSLSCLSPEGEKQLNGYAHGGFDVLLEWFDDRPRTLEAFLPLYKRYLSASLETEA